MTNHNRPKAHLIVSVQAVFGRLEQEETKRCDSKFGSRKVRCGLLRWDLKREAQMI